MIPITIIIIVFAVFICEKASLNLDNKDHKAIVIDELAGMWVALIPILFIASTQQERTLYAVIAFISFRFFDILKPFPISYLDTRFKNGFGIVVDDLAAGIFAGLFTILITTPLT
jgi:phosphatidylglycerophosphatase A